METIQESSEVQNIIPTMESKLIKTTQNKPKQLGVYNLVILTKKVVIPVISVGKNIRNILEKLIANKYEGQCDVDGYIRLGSTRIITYSSGILKGSDIIFEVVFECLVCYPVEGMLIQCQVKNVTKAGIRADIPEGVNEISPVVIFVARDHHLTSEYFSSIQTGQNIQVRVIGSRFELNDKYVSVIAELVEPRAAYTKQREQLKDISFQSKPSLFPAPTQSLLPKQTSLTKTMKATTKGKRQIKPLSTIISEEEAGPIQTQELTIAALGAAAEVAAEEKQATAQVEAPQPEFDKPVSIPMSANIQKEVMSVIEGEPTPLPEPVIQPTISTIKKPIRRKLIIKE